MTKINKNIDTINILSNKKLEHWLNLNVKNFKGPMNLKKIEGGQSNPTYLITTDDKKYVLRSKPAGVLLNSAHAVDREFRIISSLKETNVPVPKAFALCEDTKIIGTIFFIMEYIEGRIFFDPTLPNLSNTERKNIYCSMNKTISALHNVKFKNIGLQNYGKIGNYVSRQVKRWTEQYRASETEKIHEIENLIGWIPKNIPNDKNTTLVHGDFRIDNLIFDPTKPIVIGVIDWEISTLGHPLADFAYHVMAWRLSKKEFRGLSDAPLNDLGIPNEKEYLQNYLKLTNQDYPKNWEFYLAYNMFRLAAILQGIKGRVRDGTASSAEAERLGNLVQPVAKAGCSIIDKL